MLKAIALGLLVILGGVLALIAMQPSAFEVERSAAIHAPAGLIYAHIQDLHAWEAWSPWAKMDPAMKSSYEGTESGVGAITSWDGPKAGKGRMTITAVKPDQEVDIKLEFLAPMQATNRALFTLTPDGDATNVTWRMEGSNGFVGKAFGLLMNMDEMVGGDFERGLASLQSIAEADASKRSAP